MPEFTLDEMEELSKADDAVKPAASLSEIKLDAEETPAAFKGKSVADLVEENRRLEASLRISEDARTSLRSAAERVSDPREEKPVADPADTITREEFEELLKTDPMQALQIHERRLLKSLDTHLATRFGPMVRGGIDSQERAAKDRYKEEFELFGDQIKKVASQLNNDVLATQAGWDDVVAYVRGRPENFEKLVTRKSGRSPIEAREEERTNTGFTARSGNRETAPREDTAGLDATQLKIAAALNMTPAEYKKWGRES